MPSEKPLAFDFIASLDIATAVLEKYKADWPKWFKRIDGTPIPNDLCCRMAEAYRDEFKKAIEAHAQHMKVFLEELAPYLGVDGEVGETFKPRDLIVAAAAIREKLATK